eukprot:COSAG02_NODE_2640_length_8349_cov_40.398545_2_plen_730_part_00
MRACVYRLVPFNDSIREWLYARIGLADIRDSANPGVEQFAFHHFDGTVEVDPAMTNPAACLRLCQENPECAGFSYEYERPGEQASGSGGVLARDPTQYYHECYLKSAMRDKSGAVDVSCLEHPFTPWESNDPNWIGVSALAGCSIEGSCLLDGVGKDFGAKNDLCDYAPIVAIYTNHIDHPKMQVPAAALMEFWEYNSRIYTTIDSLMIGPLIVAVWVGFAVRNLLPWILHNRLRWLAVKRGQKIGCCARVLITATSCFGGHDKEVGECLQDQKSYELFRRKLGMQLFAVKAKRNMLLDVFHALRTLVQKKRGVVGDVDDSWDKTQAVVSHMVRQHLVPRLLRKPTDLPGWSAKWFESGGSQRCCRCGLDEEEEQRLQIPANNLFVESELAIYDPQDEYDELATQFSYVSVFTIVIPIGALMSLCRNLLEAHWDALHAFRDFRRPIPRLINSESTIGEWETVFQFQVYIACTLTTALFCFCTGHLEAFSELLASSLASGNATAQDAPHGMDAGFLSCQPSAIYDKVWTYGPNSECAEFEMDTEDISYPFKQFMAPNLQCWELEQHRAPPEGLPLCMWDRHDFDVLKRGMGFHQLSIRSLTWLLLLLLNLLIAAVVSSHKCFPPKTAQQVKEEDEEDDRSRELQAQVLFPTLYQQEHNRKLLRLDLPRSAMRSEIEEKEQRIAEEERRFVAQAQPGSTTSCGRSRCEALIARVCRGQCSYTMVDDYESRQ